MSTKAIAKTKKKPIPEEEKDRIKDVMGDDSLVLAAKSQHTINMLKDLDGHFYSVGRYKDAEGNWKDKMEPDSFAIQTMAGVQKINCETLSVEWENPDALKSAAVRVRVRAWKGSHEKTVELRYSMRTIAMKYVSDKISERKKYVKNKGMESSPAEWKEDDILISEDGWMEPKDSKKKIEMLKYLTDQYAFLDRTAETKAARRANLAILGFDWRDPSEIHSETGETGAVQDIKTPQVPDEAFKLIDEIKKVATKEQLTKIEKKVDKEIEKYEQHVHKMVIAELSTKMLEISQLEVDPPKMVEIVTPDNTTVDIAKKEEPEDEKVEEVSGGELNKMMITFKNCKSARDMRFYWTESCAPAPLDAKQKKSLRILARQVLTQLNKGEIRDADLDAIFA